MLFENLIQLEFVGMSGNSNPRWKDDWLEILIGGATADSYTESATWRDNTCEFGSVRVVEVFY